jgi:hypothetical protein
VTAFAKIAANAMLFSMAPMSFSLDRSLTSCVAIALLLACSRNSPRRPQAASRQAASPPEVAKDGAEVDVGSLVQSEAVASLDVLIPADGNIPMALDSARKKAQQDGLVLVDSLPATASEAVITIQLKSLADEEWPRHLRGYVASKVDPDELPDLMRSAGVVHMEAHAPPSRAWHLLRTVTMHARDLAAAQRGWIYDPYRAELHSPETFAASIPDGQLRDVRSFTRMMAVVSTKGDLDHVRSIGLWRLGLPELYLPNVVRADLDRAREIVRATAQTLLQNGGVTRRGVIEVDLTRLPPDWPKPAAGTRRFTWSARWMRGPIHKNAMLIVLSVPGAQDKDPQPLTTALREYGGEEARDE